MVHGLSDGVLLGKCCLVKSWAESRFLRSAGSYLFTCSTRACVGCGYLRLQWHGGVCRIAGCWAVHLSHAAWLRHHELQLTITAAVQLHYTHLVGASTLS